LIAACKSATDRNTPRFNLRLVRMAKKPSTAFIHEAEMGVKWMAREERDAVGRPSLPRHRRPRPHSATDRVGVRSRPPTSCAYGATSTMRGPAASARSCDARGSIPRCCRLASTSRRRRLWGVEGGQARAQDRRTQLAGEHARLIGENKRLMLRLQRAEAIVEIQKKWLRCWACRCRRRGVLMNAISALRPTAD
jgi:hypothetical protein